MTANGERLPGKAICIGTGLLLLLAIGTAQAQTPRKAILAYYAGPPERLDSFDAGQMTHIIYCFGHVDSNNRMILATRKDTLVIQKMVAMKAENPGLKV